MMLDTDAIVSMAEAEEDFSRVTPCWLDRTGTV